jgi:5-formyltetrahydrofolate cyclo-ligase
MQPIDLVVCGSVAVNRVGVRLGKGAGFSDIEVALLAEAGLLSERTTIVTTVHDLQVVDEELPEAEHDFRVDFIVTPQRVIACGQPKRPRALSWESLSTEKIAAIPVLAGREKRQRKLSNVAEAGA